MARNTRFEGRVNVNDRIGLVLAVSLMSDAQLRFYATAFEGRHKTKAAHELVLKEMGRRVAEEYIAKHGHPALGLVPANA